MIATRGSSTATVAVVVPTWNRQSLLARCLEALRGQSQTPQSVIVVDNGSTDGTAEFIVERNPWVSILRNPVNRGFAAAINQAYGSCQTGWIGLMNNDAVAAPTWLEQLLELGERDERMGAVASRMMFRDHPDVVSSAGIRVDPSGGAWDWLIGERTWPEQPVEVFGASGGACLLRREMLDDVGQFQEDFFAYLEDVDLAWRARARGWKAVLAPNAVVYHALSSTAGEGSAFKRYYLARNKWRVIVRNYPWRGLRQHFAAILFYDALSIGNALAQGDRLSLRGRVDTWRQLPLLLRQRTAVQRRTTVGWAELQRALSPLEPPSVLYRRGRRVGHRAARPA